MVYSVKVPANLNFKQLAEKLPFNDLPMKQERSEQFLYVFCGALVELREAQRYKKKDKGFTMMCAKWMHEIHAEYHLFVGYLLEAGIWRSDNKFIPNEKCTGFQFTDAYKKQGFKEVEITDFRLRKAMRRQRELQITEKRKDITAHRHIIDWYLTHKLCIDADAAGQWVNEYYEQNLIHLDAKNLSKDDLNKAQKDLWDTCNSMVYFIGQIANDDYDEWDFSVDAKGRRLHGMFSFNKKELRMFVTYDGKKLVSVDIKNSQPYFSTLLLEPEFWQSKKVKTNKLQLIDIAPEMYRVFRSDGTAHKIITLLESAKSLIQRDVSTGEYKNLAQSGGIYEYLMVELPKRLSASFMMEHGERVSTRKAIKRETLRILYCKNSDRRKGFYETARVFQSMFPNVAKVFELVKEGQYEWLPRILQRVESRLVLQEVCREIAAEYPGIPLFTIHDGIVTTEGNEHAIKAVLDRVLTERVGCAPGVAFENWVPENAYPIKVNKDYICENEELYEDIEML
jgi:hypothetical protein